MKKKDIAFTFASAEVNKIGQNFIKLIELLTGKLTLRNLYDQYIKENIRQLSLQVVWLLCYQLRQQIVLSHQH